jgi:hypothetical protein
VSWAFRTAGDRGNVRAFSALISVPLDLLQLLRVNEISRRQALEFVETTQLQFEALLKPAKIGFFLMEF